MIRLSEDQLLQTLKSLDELADCNLIAIARHAAGRVLQRHTGDTFTLAPTMQKIMDASKVFVLAVDEA